MIVSDNRSGHMLSIFIVEEGWLCSGRISVACYNICQFTKALVIDWSRQTFPQRVRCWLPWKQTLFFSCVPNWKPRGITISLQPLSHVIELFAQTSQKNSTAKASDTYHSCHGRFYRPANVSNAHSTHIVKICCSLSDNCQLLKAVPHADSQYYFSPSPIILGLDKSWDSLEALRNADNGSHTDSPAVLYLSRRWGALTPDVVDPWFSGEKYGFRC